jgi:hypothetical protein
MAGELRYLDDGRVSVAPLPRGTVGMLALLPTGRYFIIAGRLAAEDRRAAVEHLGTHAADAAVLDDPGAACTTDRCAWARLAFGSTAARCASGTA